MSVNSEAIYATRPWKIFGEGPGTQASAQNPAFNEKKRKDLTAADVRFTTKEDAVCVCDGLAGVQSSHSSLGHEYGTASRKN